MTTQLETPMFDIRVEIMLDTLPEKKCHISVLRKSMSMLISLVYHQKSWVG